MPIKVISKFTKNDSSTQWAHEMQTTDLKNYIATTFVETGKLMTHDIEISDDNLTCTHIFIWKDIECFVEYQDDPTVHQYHVYRGEYNELHSIMRVQRDITQI